MRTLVKFGGAAMENEATRMSVCAEIASAFRGNVDIVVVHGGGKEISHWIERMGGQPQFVRGLRVTDADSMRIIEMVLSGAINSDLTARLTRLGQPSVGLNGRTAALLEARRISPESGVDMGLIGEVAKVNPRIVTTLLADGYLPIISPVAESSDGEVLNINADYAAAALAGSLKCAQCIFLTDINGVQHNGQVVPHLTATRAKTLINSGVITGGMIPKIECALRAIDEGCGRVVIANGAAPNVIERCLSGEAFGTVITAA